MGEGAKRKASRFGGTGKGVNGRIFSLKMLLEVEAEGEVKHFREEIIVFNSPGPVSSYEISQ